MHLLFFTFSGWVEPSSTKNDDGTHDKALQAARMHSNASGSSDGCRHALNLRAVLKPSEKVNTKLLSNILRIYIRLKIIKFYRAKLAPVFTLEELSYLLLPREGVVDSYIIKVQYTVFCFDYMF